MKEWWRELVYVRASDRRAIVAILCIAIFAVGVMLVVDALEGAKQYEARNGGDAGEKVDTVSGSDEAVREWMTSGYEGKGTRDGRSYGKKRPEVAKIIASSSMDVEERKEYNKFRTLTKVDVNTADSALLCRVPGIGEKRAQAIVKYRKRLGGFYSEQQLMEIGMIPEELMEWFCVAKEVEVRKLDVNSKNFKEINAHPYITYDQTKAIFQYIRLYGEIKDVESLRKANIFSEEELEKLLPYLDL